MTHHKTRKVALLSALFFTTVVFFAACKKTETELGTTLLPGDDTLNVSFVDTVTIRAWAELEDSVKTSNLSIAQLGSCNDPVFGTKDASFYTQLRLSTNNVDFGNLAQISLDSVVLQLVYETTPYGNTNAQIVEVYEVTQTIDPDASYYTKDVLTTTAINMVYPGAETIVPYADSVPAINEVVVGETIRLSDAFGNQLLNQSGSSNLADNDAFTSYFKGLHIKTNNGVQAAGQGAILPFDLLHEKTKVVLYYTNSALTSQQSFDLLINASCARFTHTAHDYTGTAIEAQLADATLGQQTTYMQGVGGLRTIIEFPYLETLRNDPDIIINRAELLLPIELNSDNTYTVSPELSIKLQDAAGTQISAATTIFEGDFDDTEDQYVVNIARHLQKVISGEQENLKLSLTSRETATAYDRAILNGPDAATDPLKLIIYYTKY